MCVCECVRVCDVSVYYLTVYIIEWLVVILLPNLNDIFCTHTHTHKVVCVTKYPLTYYNIIYYIIANVHAGSKENNL